MHAARNFVSGRVIAGAGRKLRLLTVLCCAVLCCAVLCCAVNFAAVLTYCQALSGLLRKRKLLTFAPSAQKHQAVVRKFAFFCVYYSSYQIL